MERHGRNILVVGVSPSEFDHVAPFLERDDFDVDRFPSAGGALELLAEVAFEVVIVRHPLKQMELAVFLDAVRAQDSACAKAPLLVLAADDLPGAQGYVGRGANRVVSIEDSARDVQRMVSGLLNVAPRRAARFTSRLVIQLGGTKDMITCRTVNVSDTGMLIETDRQYEIGTRINVSFQVDGDARPIAGIAEVVRQAKAERDPCDGIGLRFLSFAGDSQRRFQTYLGRLPV